MQDKNLRKQKAWDEAARGDSYFYIADWRKDWNREDFFASGAKDVEKFTRDFFEEMHFDPEGKKMLDIGCGLGRMTRAFAEAYGVDFSQEMIEKTKELNKDKPNLTFFVNNGRDLAMFEDNSFDFCFSYIVFQHISRMDILTSYIKEIARVLKPGGLFKFQVGSRYRFRGKIAIPRFAANFLRTTLQGDNLIRSLLVLLLRRDRITIAAYPGVLLSPRQLEKILGAANLEVSQISEKDGLWCSGRKPQER